MAAKVRVSGFQMKVDLLRARDGKTLEDIANWMEVNWRKVRCDLRFKVASDDYTEDEIIRGFEIEFESKKKKCAVLIVRTPNSSEKWTIAGFSDDRDFRTIVIDDPSLELSKELKRKPINKSRIVKLTTSMLGHTIKMSKVAVHLFLNAEHPDKSLQPSRDGSHHYREIDPSILQQYCDLFAAPKEWFTTHYTAAQFKSLIRVPLWTRLMNLVSPGSESKVELRRAEEDEFERPLDLEAPKRLSLSIEPKDKEIEPFTIDDRFGIELRSRSGWHVVLLRRQPGDQLDCLLPSETSENLNLPYAIDSTGYLRFPPDPKIYVRVDRDDSPGVHTLVAVFHERPYIDTVIQKKQFLDQFSKNAGISRREAALSQLVYWIEKQRDRDPVPFQIAATEFLVLI